ncbi:T9SS type A sorting domain-containing protein [Puia sp. P3]|uniref:T9SS type A sorting domain-containing protein n=1 Tax=Puia sp. P3 TaxID=3423952 RepID=UPI003D6664A5
MLGNSYQYLFSSPSLTDFSVRFTGGAGTAAPSYTDGPNVNDWAYNTGATPTMWLNGVQSMTTTAATHIVVAQAQSPTNGTYSISNTFLNRGMYNNDPVYELLVYSAPLSNTQRVLLENYQASEWGLGGSLPSSGYTKFTPPTKPTWNKNLVGIGYILSTDNVLSDVAGSTDGLGFSSGITASDFLGSAGYVMAAHNAQTNTVNFNSGLTNVPVNSYVWNRSWYVRTFNGNSSGNVTLNFNFNDYNGTTPNPAYYYSILYNATDGTFATGTNKLVSYTQGSISGNIVSMIVKASNLPAGYYTIVYNQNNVLPISLEAFTVTRQSDNSALAKWTVAADLGQDQFSLQRSADGSQFNSIAAIAGVGNGFSSQSYSFTDNSPLSGTNYYRLLMTDASGVSSYSPVVTLAFGGSPRQLTLYPIPAKDMLHISAPGISGGGSVNIISNSGQVLASYKFSQPDGATLPVGSLTAGSYIAYVLSGQRSFPITFIKQ